MLFGPRVQPELWDESAMRRLAERLRPDGSMVTYCTGCIQARLESSWATGYRASGSSG